MSQLAELLDKLETTLSVVYLGYQPEADKPRDQRWPHFAYRVTVSRAGQSYSTDYRQGVGYAKPIPSTYKPHLADSARQANWYADIKNIKVPTVADVVYSLMSDAQSGSETFEDFCSNCGYDTDSRKAFDTYLSCQASLGACRRLFGEHYQAVAEAY